MSTNLWQQATCSGVSLLSFKTSKINPLLNKMCINGKFYIFLEMRCKIESLF